MSCASVKEEHWRAVPMAITEQPRIIDLFRPRLSPRTAVRREPAQLPILYMPRTAPWSCALPFAVVVLIEGNCLVKAEPVMTPPITPCSKPKRMKAIPQARRMRRVRVLPCRRVYPPFKVNTIVMIKARSTRDWGRDCAGGR